MIYRCTLAEDQYTIATEHFPLPTSLMNRIEKTMCDRVNDHVADSSVERKRPSPNNIRRASSSSSSSSPRTLIPCLLDFRSRSSDSNTFEAASVHQVSRAPPQSFRWEAVRARCYGLGLPSRRSSDMNPRREAIVRRPRSDPLRRQRITAHYLRRQSSWTAVQAPGRWHRR